MVRLLSEVTGLADVVWRPHSVNLGLEGWRKPSADGTADAAEDTAASESRAQQLLEGNSESEGVTPGKTDPVEGNSESEAVTPGKPDSVEGSSESEAVTPGIPDSVGAAGTSPPLPVIRPVEACHARQ